MNLLHWTKKKKKNIHKMLKIFKVSGYLFNKKFTNFTNPMGVRMMTCKFFGLHYHGEIRKLNLNFLVLSLYFGLDFSKLLQVTIIVLLAFMDQNLLYYRHFFTFIKDIIYIYTIYQKKSCRSTWLLLKNVFR